MRVQFRPTLQELRPLRGAPPRKFSFKRRLDKDRPGERGPSLPLAMALMHYSADPSWYMRLKALPANLGKGFWARFTARPPMRDYFGRFVFQEIEKKRGLSSDEGTKQPILSAMAFSLWDVVDALLKVEDKGVCDNLTMELCNRHIGWENPDTPPPMSLLEKMVMRGIPLSPQWINRRSPLVLATMEANTPQVQTLLSNGVNPNLNFFTTSLGTGDFSKRRPLVATPLFFSVLRGTHDISRTLLAAGAQKDAVSFSGNTPVIGAVLGPRRSFLKPLLFEYNADPNAVNDHGDSALILAAGRGLEPRVRLLLDARANVEIKNKKGFTALIKAAQTGRTGIVARLLHAGAQVERTSDEGKSALFYAFVRAHDAIVGQLVSAGAVFTEPEKRILAKDWDLAKVVRRAALNGHIHCLRLGLQMGCDPNAEDSQGNGLLSLAAISGQKEIVDFLLADPRVNIRHRNHSGKEALDYTLNRSDPKDK